jgi:hypothetical protein
MTEKLTQEQKDYLIDRCDESASGRILVPTHIIKKYREYTGDMLNCNAVIRAKIQNIYMNLW